MRRFDIALLAAAIALCAGSTWRLSGLFYQPPSGLLVRPPSPSVVDPPGVSVDAPESRRWPRPLFSPPVSPADASSDVTGAITASKMPKLVGVIADGDRRVAIIAYGGALLRVDENHKVGAWTVVRVDLHSALLQDAENSLRLRLDSAAKRN